MRIFTPVLVAVVLGAIGVAAANALAEPEAHPARAANVTIGDDFFNPTSKTINKGATVKWTWRGSDPHNVTVESGPSTFATATKTKGTFSKTFRKTGTYKIVCTIHDMRMTLKVKKP